MDKLYGALVKFQAQIGDIPKTAQGYGYKYAPLNVVWAHIRKPLSECGLSVVQMPISSGNLIGVRTILGCVSGDSIESEVFAPVEAKKGLSVAQCVGVTITYLRRYGLSAVLGLTSDEDTDAQQVATPPQSAPKSKTDLDLARELVAKIESGKGTLEQALEYAEKHNWSQAALDILTGVTE